MEAFFSREIQAGLHAARLEAMKKSSRIRVSAGAISFPVLRLWKSGFSLQSDAPPLRGRVDLHEAGAHLFQCLIVTSAEADGERHYEFKRATAVADKAAADFDVGENVPAGLIEYREATAGR